jgi:hypothetical protein
MALMSGMISTGASSAGIGSMPLASRSVTWAATRSSLPMIRPISQLSTSHDSGMSSAIGMVARSDASAASSSRTSSCWETWTVRTRSIAV